jgi:hypothetical protein
MSGQSLKKFCVSFLIFFLSAAFVGYFFVDSAFANYSSPYYSPKITIQSPTDGGVYTGSEVSLKILITAGYGKYVADGVQTTVKLDGVNIQEGSYTFDFLMQNLNNGLHSIEVYSIADYGTTNRGPGYESDVKISFTVNSGVAPTITFSSKTEFGSNGTISVGLNDGDSQVLYRLDDKINITVQKKSEIIKNFGYYQFNVTFNGLAAGSHSLVVFATDRLGNGAKQSLTFNVAGSQAQTETVQVTQVPFTLSLGSLIIAAVVIVVVIAFFAGIFFVRRKKAKTVG